MREHQDIYDTANTITRGRFERSLIEGRAQRLSFGQLAAMVNSKWKLDVSESTVRGWFRKKGLPGYHLPPLSTRAVENIGDSEGLDLSPPG